MFLNIKFIKFKYFCFNQGWQNERVVADFKKDGRILMVKSGDPRTWWRRVSTILETVNYDLGFIEESKLSHTNSKVNANDDQL